ncbi:MAG: phosphoribosylaminoimidazole carboxylase, partial [Thermoprotei archaeon]
EEAERRIRLLAIEELEQLARLDVSRVMRRGVPEIVLGEGKSHEELRRIASLMLSSAGRAIISRVSRKDADYVVEKVKPHRYRYEELARILILYSEDYRPVKIGGRVAIMSGGTADIRVAEEARVVAEEMGCDVKPSTTWGLQPSRER